MMPWTLKDNQLFLYRPDLAAIPPVSLPAGYSECPGSESLVPRWVEMLDRVFGKYSLERVRPQLESEYWNPDRVKLVAKGEALAAMSMAWYEPEIWPRSGFVFWVAVEEGHRGLGLGSYVLSRALQHIADDGYIDAVLYTEDSNFAAIRLYLKFGFVPMITGTSAGERERWERGLRALDISESLSTLRTDYDRIIKR
jgi:mycothiol synthase